MEGHTERNRRLVVSREHGRWLARCRTCGWQSPGFSDRSRATNYFRHSHSCDAAPSYEEEKDRAG